MTTTTQGRRRRSAVPLACCVLCVLCVLCVAPAAGAAQEPAAPQAVSRRAAAGRDRQARRPRLRDADERVAHGPAHAQPRRRCRRCCRRSPSTPTATSGIARSCCSPASTIRGRRTRCASRWPARTIGCATVAYSFFEHNPDPRDGRRSSWRRSTRSRREFVRPALVRALAALGDDPRVRQALVREVGARRGLLPQRRHRGARRLQGAVRVRRARRRRQARWSAAGRCGARAREDRRQARARDAGRAAADGAAARRSRRSRRRSACSASTASRTRAISSRR